MIVAATPAPVRVLQRNQLGAPTFRCDPGSLSRYGRCGAGEDVLVHPPADRWVTLQQPVDQLVSAAVIDTMLHEAASLLPPPAALTG